MIDEYELNIEKINDKLQRFIPIKVPKNYSIMDIKSILDQNFGLKIQYQFLFHRDRQLNDRDKISSIYEKNNQERTNKINKIDMQLLYNFDSDEELINQGNKNNLTGNQKLNEELNIKTYLIKQETVEENPNQNLHPNKRSHHNNYNDKNQPNSKNENNFIHRKRGRYDNYTDNRYNYNESIRQNNSDFNLWNTNKRTSKGLFSSNMKIYHEENEYKTQPNEGDLMIIDENAHDFEKLKNILDFDKEYFVMPKRTFDESEYSIKITERKELNIEKAYKDQKTKKLYELCYKFLNDGYVNIHKIPHIVFETSCKDVNIQPLKKGIDDIYLKIAEIDDYIFNVEDLVDKLCKSKLKREGNLEENLQHELNVNQNKNNEVIMIIEETIENEINSSENMKNFSNKNPLEDKSIVIDASEKNDEMPLIHSNNFSEELSIDKLTVSTINNNTTIIQEDEKRLIKRENSNSKSNFKQKNENDVASGIVHKSKHQENNNLIYSIGKRDSNFKDMNNRSFQSKLNESNLFLNLVSPKQISSSAFGREELIQQFEFLYNKRITGSTSIHKFIEQLEVFNKSLKEIKIDENFVKMNSKVNIILDLDNTLIHGEVHSNGYREVPKHIKPIFRQELDINDKKWFVTCTLRPYIKEFFQKIKQFSNFYVNTRGLEFYGRHISQIVERECNITIPKNNIKGREFDQKSLKQFKDYSDSFLGMSIILDDSPEVWNRLEKSDQIVLNSMKYVSYVEEKRPNQKELKEFLKAEFMKYFLKTCNIKDGSSSCSNISGLELDDEYYIPLFAEYNHSNKFQFKYFGEIIEKIYKIVTITKCDLHIFIFIV